MSDGEATSSDERASVGVVAPETNERKIVDAIADAGGVSNVGSAETVAESAAVVAVGDTALSDLAAAGVSAPVLPVAAGVTGVPLDDARRAIERVLAEEYERRELPFVYVDTDEESGRALFDVSLTTAEPGTISEFAVETLCEPSSRDSADAPVARFRADGVVVATPAGSRGYARAAGGPVVIPGSEVLSVVPIAPFSTDPDHWVLPLSGLSLTIERDEVDVELFVDGKSLCTVGPGATVHLTRDGALGIVIVPESSTGRK